VDTVNKGTYTWLMGKINVQISHLPNEIILDKHLKLSVARKGRFEEFKAGLLSDFEHMRQWLPWVQDDIDGSSKDFYEESVKRKEDDKEVNWNILLDEKLAGTISFLKRGPDEQTLEIGYWLFSQYTGQGIMKRCANFLVDLAFEQTVADAVLIACDKENLRSANVAIRAGLKYFREYEDKKEAAFDSGVSLNYKITRKQWEQSKCAI
jgi:ribosomal-protein-serine acetyltransferase